MFERRKRRSFLDDEKGEICARAPAPVVSVSHVARRCAVHANHIFKCLKAPRFSLVVQDLIDDAAFLPVEIDGCTTDEPICQELASFPASSPVSARRVDITLSDGLRLVIEGLTALSAAVRLVQGLAV